VPTAEAREIEALYRQHREGLVRLVERQLHDRDDAEDVVQTAFLDAQRALERGTIPHNPPAWLAAIALNAARRVRRRQVSVEALEEYATEQASRLPEIKAALAGLPKHEQTAVLYRDVLGLSYAEMAEQMGRSVPAVTMLLHRARSRLRGLLGIALVGEGLWRWLRGNEWEAAAANAAGVVVVAGGLATAGLVVAGHVARATPSAAGTRTTAATRPPAPASRDLVGAGVRVRVVRKHRASERHDASATPARTAHSSPVDAPATAAVPNPLPTTRPAAARASAPAPSPPRVQLPVASLPPLPGAGPKPTLTLPTAATAAVTSGTTATVATPVATVTVSVP